MFINNLFLLYGNLIGNFEKIESQISIIFELIGIILTLVTFLTVMMSVQYQENIYNAHELKFDIKNEENFTNINKNISKILFIEESKKNYRKIVKLFTFVVYMTLLIAMFLAPIYIYKIKNVISFIIVVILIVFTFIAYRIVNFFNKDLDIDYYLEEIDANNFENNYSEHINIFPQLSIKNECIFIVPNINIKNYAIILKICIGISEFVLISYKCKNEINISNIPQKKNNKLINWNNLNEEDIEYYVVLDNKFINYHVKVEHDTNEFKIFPTHNKIKNTIPHDVIECSKCLKDNEIIIKR